MRERDWTGKDATRDAYSRRLLSSTLPVAATRSSAYETRAPTRKEWRFFDGSFCLNHKAFQSIARNFERHD